MLMLKKLEELLDKAADGDKEVNLEFLCGEALYWIRRLERDREDFVGVTNYQLVLRKSEEEMAEFIVWAVRILIVVRLISLETDLMHDRNRIDSLERRMRRK